MESTKVSDVISSGTEIVDRMRRALNSAYSEVPSELNQVFDAALDQVGDQQVKVGEALTRYISTANIADAEQAIATAAAEAERNALRAARAYADDQSEKADKVYIELTHIPININDLSDQKRKLDAKFGRAIQLHEENKVSGLEPLLEVAGGYMAWSADARARIVESQGIVDSDKRKVRLQIAGIIVAIVLGLLNLIFNLVKNYSR